MIKSILMRNCATYDDSGVKIDDCTKINFIYGANGSGKSTIGRFLDNQGGVAFSDCKIEHYGEESEEVIVYNREFREGQIKAHEGLKGVFTLGSSTIEDIEKIDKLKEEADERTEELKTARKTLEKTEENKKQKREQFKEYLWQNLYKKYSAVFTEAFKSVHTSKEKLFSKVEDRFRLGSSTIHTLTELQERAKTVFSETELKQLSLLPKLSAVVIQELHEVELNSIWNKVIVGNGDAPIATFISKFNNSDWVSKGRDYIKDEICPFCHKPTITPEFLHDLETFFDDKFERDTALLKHLQQEYIRKVEVVNSYFDSISEYDQNLDYSSVDFELLKKIAILVKTRLSENATLIESKITEPSRKITLQSTSTEFVQIKELIDKANELITRNNDIERNLTNEKRKLVNDIWDFLTLENWTAISQYKTEIDNFAKAIDGINKKVGGLRKRISDLRIEIIEAEKNVTSIQPTIDEMNRLLRSFGFTGFRIVASSSTPNYYQIQRRDGSLVESTLSEGEETFITFLYFMQMCKGAVEVSKVSVRRIILLDDPICSLDSNVLYVVSTMIKDLAKKIRNGNSDVEQLFVLTHNVFFHKEVSFIDGRKNKLADVHYWVLRKNNEISEIQPYGDENPIHTSYQLLWNELKQNENLSFITAQNIMRRILEYYFSLTGAKWSDNLLESFDILEERMVCESLLSWVNDGSHEIPDDFYVDTYSDQIDRYRSVFREIFEQTNHLAHYNMMMGLEEIS